MEILKKDIIKEMEEKSRNNLNKGIDISVSILKHEFPFITGWDYKSDPETYRSSIYLVLNADMNLASEFYNSPIRNVYKHAEAKVSYPFSPLEISTELNEEEKYKLFKVIQKSLIEIYDEIPSELRHEFETYASEKKEPKELYIEGFIFEKPKENIYENKRSEVEKNLEAINLILSEISWDGLCEIWVEYNENDGDYEIRSKSTKRHFDYDNINNELGYLDNTLRSMGLRTYIFTPWYVEECEDEVEFLNEDYSPAGKEVIPNEIVVHKSNPIFRDSIMTDGLKAKAGECYKIYAGYGEKCIPAIFATNSKNKRAWFESTYDDDIWFIDTTKIPDVKWFKDRHYESTKKHIVTFQDIPRDALTLFYEGTGKSEDLMNESEEETTTNYVPIIEEIIEPFKNEDAVCEINVWYDEEDDMYSVYLVLGTEELNDKFYYVDGIRTYRNKLARKIETEIKSYLPIDNLYVGSYGKPNCGWSPLNENWFKVPSSDYNSLEKIINLEMREKYGWWKDIKINTLNYIELYGDVQIEAELTVDVEWGANQWREFYQISEFPGNKGWEDDGYELVRFGDIIDSTYAEVIRDNLREILRYALNIEAHNMSFRNVYLIFE